MTHVTLDPLTEAELDAIVAWRYPDAYAVYDGRESDRAVLGDPANGYLAIRHAGEFLGYVCTGPEARVPGMEADPRLVDLGMGLRPDRIGRGLSASVVPAVLVALRAQLGPVGFRAVVKEFNGRAQAAVTRAGFAPAGRLENRDGAYLLFERPASD